MYYVTVFIFSKLKRQRREADHWSISSAEVKSGRVIPPLHPYVFMVWHLINEVHEQLYIHGTNSNFRKGQTNANYLPTTIQTKANDTTVPWAALRNLLSVTELPKAVFTLYRTDTTVRNSSWREFIVNWTVFHHR
jgi:hypothetical protein